MLKQVWRFLRIGSVLIVLYASGLPAWTAASPQTTGAGSKNELEVSVGTGPSMVLSEGSAQRLEGGPTTRGGNNGTDCWNPGEPLIGPDVIVGDLIDISNYGAHSGLVAYAIGTTSCNIGSSNLLWEVGTPNVPVIGQNMFRFKDGRFEHIGQSWLKYAFTALTQNVCGCGCNGQGGTVLGVGCSDPYCCGLNGQQENLGPKYEVNPFTGSHPGDPANPPYSGILARRLLVRVSDLNPSQNGGGLYFVEGQYVTPDDAAAGNQFNNVSYHRVNIAPTTWAASLTDSIHRGEPAIRAWQNNDPTVAETDILIPNEGLLILAYQVTDRGDGYWHYEFALQNQNSDRAVASFAVPVDDLADLQNVAFHDVDYHSGEGISGTDWAVTRSGGQLVWATIPYSQDPNANALRWGTLYNFRFDADRPPTTATLALELFKPGDPPSVSAMALGPEFAPCFLGACDDDIFCNGVEACLGGICFAGEQPCAGLICNEGSNACQDLPRMYCDLPGDAAAPGTVISAPVYVDLVDDEVRSYSATLSITQTSGTGTVTVECPGGVVIDTTRPDYIFYNSPDDFLAPNCSLRRVSASLSLGSVPVDPQPVYLGTYLLTVSEDATEGSTFELSITPPGSGTYIRDEANVPIPLAVQSPSLLTIANCNPCQLYGDIEPVGNGTFFGDCDLDVDDIFCALAGFSLLSDCPGADLEPCGGDGDVDVDDLLAELDAFGGQALCLSPCG